MLLVRVVRTWETDTDGGISGQKAQVEATVGENGRTGIYGGYLDKETCIKLARSLEICCRGQDTCEQFVKVFIAQLEEGSHLGRKQLI